MRAESHADIRRRLRRSQLLQDRHHLIVMGSRGDSRDHMAHDAVVRVRSITGK